MTKLPNVYSSDLGCHSPLVRRPVGPPMLHGTLNLTESHGKMLTSLNRDFKT